MAAWFYLLCIAAIVGIAAIGSAILEWLYWHRTL